MVDLHDLLPPKCKCIIRHFHFFWPLDAALRGGTWSSGCILTLSFGGAFGTLESDLVLPAVFQLGAALESGRIIGSLGTGPESSTIVGSADKGMVSPFLLSVGP